MTGFEKAIVALCAAEFEAAMRSKDAERLSGMLDVLGASLATTLSMTAKFTSVDLDELVEETCDAVAASARSPEARQAS